MTLHLDADGNWLELRRAVPPGPKRPALFLDRDGTVIEEIAYLSDPARVALIPGAGATIAAANRAGWPVVLVTNQAGVGRAIFAWQDFAAVQDAVCRALANEGAMIDMVLACGYHATEGKGLYLAAHPWRKPGPGMMLEAAKRLPIDLSHSWIAGDNEIDMQAGRAAGLAGGLHVLTGHGAEHRAKALALAAPGFPVTGIRDIGEIPRHIPALGGARA